MRFAAVAVGLAALLSAPASATAPVLLPTVDRIGAPGTQTVRLAPIADTYADSLAQDKNFGDRDLLRLNQQRKYTRIVYLAFEVDGLPADTTGLEATLTLAPTASRTFAVRAHSTGEFDESTLTWNDRPPVGEMLAESGPPQLGLPVVLDLSGAITGDGTVSVALTAEGFIQASTWFPSRESSADGPTLWLTWPGARPAAEVTPTPDPTGDPTESPAPDPDPTDSPEPTESPTPSPTTAPPPDAGPPPSLEPGATLLGAAIAAQPGRQSVEEELDYLESQVGRLQVRRVFDPGFTRNFMAKAGLDVGKRVTHYSFKPDMAKLASGGLDTDIRFFLDSIPAGHQTILTIWHEPENDFTTDPQKVDYRAGWRRFGELVKEQNRPELSTSWVMMVYSWWVMSGRDPMDWWPGDGVVDIIGIDTYNEGSLRGTRWDSPSRNFGEPLAGDDAIQGGLINGGQPITDWVKARGAHLGIAEFGSLENTQGFTPEWTATPTKADWITEAVDYYRSLGAVYVEYFHAGPYRGPWWLDAESVDPLHAFRDLLAEAKARAG